MVQMFNKEYNNMNLSLQYTLVNQYFWQIVQ